MAWEQWISGVWATFGALIGTLVVGELLLLVLNKIVKPLTSRTNTTLDDRLIDAAQTPVRLLGVILGTYWTLQTAYPAFNAAGHDLAFWSATFLLAWAGYTANKALNAILTWYYKELTPEHKQSHRFRINDEILPMLQVAVTATVYGVTLVILLARFGIEIGPLLTAMGIGGIAVALAVKDTLANLFAGLYLLTQKPIRRGEYIALDDEKSVIKGFVEEVGWRNTRIRTRGNYTYFIPNEKITQSNLVNFTRGENGAWKGSSVTVSAAYRHPPEHVQKILVNAVRKVQARDDRLVRNDTPLARVEDFGDNGITYRALFKIQNVFEAEAAQSEVRAQIYRDFAKARIEIPYPQRVIRHARR